MRGWKVWIEFVRGSFFSTFGSSSSRSRPSQRESRVDGSGEIGRGRLKPEGGCFLDDLRGGQGDSASESYRSRMLKDRGWECRRITSRSSRNFEDLLIEESRS
eukprot:CAMPEP_0118892194 /NCGR_PEP_ID=MMETSP1166-20130328/1887_1 /TAXON_ID=1104430 /ORGANISM="Chrysoreinhardia sp, Strain CCMP3193" /LENGTH=102 /DNA_ID=CAMNT_0006830895 /DNA_START=390 /DNA_END=698 /DNA_ORIENTATION=-